MCTFKMCAMCVQVLQLEFVCNYVSISVDVRNIAHSHTCEMCAMPMQVLQLEFFITALLPTAKIQESPFAFAHLPTYKVTKTAMKDFFYKSQNSCKMFEQFQFHKHRFTTFTKHGNNQTN